MSATAESRAASSRTALDEAISVLGDHATEFARLPVRDKAALLRACVARIADVAPMWVAAGAQAKRLSQREIGEEWLAGPLTTTRVARLICDGLDHIAVRGRPPLGTGAELGDDGRLRVELFPVSGIDRVLFGGFTGHVLMDDGLGKDAARSRQAAFFQRRDPPGRISLVLGAGNVSSIPPTDVFTKMFVEGSVCVLKMNPVNEWVGPILDRCLQPLIVRDYLRIVYGGADVGKYLVEHPAIGDVHITGSDRTHDMIVWGPPGPERERRLADNDPVLTKPITSELGNVSPVAIVPFDYSDDELWFQAQSLVSMIVNNASFNCNAAKILITSRKWRQRDRFLSMVARGLGEVPTRFAYYPGAFHRYQTLTGGRPRLETYGEATEDRLPWTVIRDIDADHPDEPLFRVEPFCGVLSETCVGSTDPVEFLDSVALFMNHKLWGTLNAAIVIHPRLEFDATVSKVLRRVIAELRYGTVAINHWPALAYGMGSTAWGGHQSVTLKDIQSGLGWVHNSFMLDGIDKSVVRGPLVARPKPVWFYDNKAGARVGERMVAVEAEPRWRKVPGVIVGALRGMLG